MRDPFLRGADPEPLVRLTVHYHGLLRMWTEI
jgi:predicted 2-oxoglutarate/Fe(II)-dependent dioxygenase YbiX